MTRSDSSPAETRRDRRGHARPVRGVRRERVAARAGPLRHEDGGGRNPKLDRIAWPSGPANQVMNFEAASWFGGRLDDDAGIGGRHVGGVGDVDRLDLLRGGGVGHVDDARVALAELDLRDDRLDVVLLGHDVGVVGVDEVGRGARLASPGWRRAASRTW